MGNVLKLPSNADVWPDVGALARQVMDEAYLPTDVLPSGFNRLDDLMDGGFRAGEVMVLAARPRVGKSAFALQMIQSIAGEGRPVGLWSLEMSEVDWIRRAISSISGISHRTLRRGGMTDSEEESLNKAVVAFHRMPIVFAVGPSDPTGFRMEAEAMIRDKDVRLLVVDYLQLMQPAKGAFNRENEVSLLSRASKSLALELEIPVLMLAQLNREAEDKRPTLRNLRESGAIEQDADMVLLLHRELDKDTDMLSSSTTAILAKNRNGESGSFHLTFDGSHMWFRESWK